jgi:LacI family transcriptional regulator
MSANIKDVARAAGVSTATVSRILNNVGPANEETRRRVRAVAEQLRYVPSALGRNLSTRRTDAVGLLLPDLYGEFFSEVIRGADQTAQDHHYHLLVSSEHSDRSEIIAALQMMRGRVDGLIIMSPHIDVQALNVNLPRGLPVVLLNCNIAGDGYDAIDIDNVGGAHQMVAHLLMHGHRRIAIIKGLENNNDARERLRGYREALREAGIDLDPAQEIAGDFSEASGFKAVVDALAFAPRPTAIFASNDSMAVGLMRGLHESGIAVPQEMAVAGFDDTTIGHYLTPPLTSVHVGISELGSQAVTRLLDQVQHKANHRKQHSLLATTLVLRESCGCIHKDPAPLAPIGGEGKEIVSRLSESDNHTTHP